MLSSLTVCRLLVAGLGAIALFDSFALTLATETLDQRCHRKADVNSPCYQISNRQKHFECTCFDEVWFKDYSDCLNHGAGAYDYWADNDRGRRCEACQKTPRQGSTANQEIVGCPKQGAATYCGHVAAGKLPKRCQDLIFPKKGSTTDDAVKRHQAYISCTCRSKDYATAYHDCLRDLYPNDASEQMKLRCAQCKNKKSVGTVRSDIFC